MTKIAFFHSIFLVILTGIAFFWISDASLPAYSLQLTAIVAVSLVLGRHLHNTGAYYLWESSAATVTVLLLTYSTGGISSPVFFFNYVLLFILSLLLEPVVPLVLSAVLGLFYVFSTVPDSPHELLSLLAFPIMTPLAYYTGEMYQKIKSQKKEIERLSDQVEDLEEKLAEEKPTHT